MIRRLVLLCCLLPLIAVTPARATNGPTVFFEPGAGDAPVIALIGRARHSIRLEVYELTDTAVEDALGRARRRGVRVRVLLEERPFGGERYASAAYLALRQQGISVRWANEGAFRFTHEKAIVIDGRLAGIFTFNLTYSGTGSNREFGVIDPRVADASALAKIFDADWSRRSPRTHLGRLVISPINARSRLSGLINGARHTLDVYAEEVEDSGLEADLIAARRRGVRVRLITSSDSAGVEMLRGGGVGTAILSSPYIHAKAIVADGKRVFIGSENISTTSLDDNREAGIILGRTAARTVERVFSGDWALGGGSIPSSRPVHIRGPFRVRVRVSPSPVRRDELLTIAAVTHPGADCSVTVTYPDGYVSRAHSLAGERRADGGRVEWSYDEGSTASGTASASVTCTLGAHRATGRATFTIR
ncbi:MAG: phospholipase D-like domain-containing protein [Chloroflexota bacterium]